LEKSWSDIRGQRESADYQGRVAGVQEQTARTEQKSREMLDPAQADLWGKQGSAAETNAAAQQQQANAQAIQAAGVAALGEKNWALNKDRFNAELQTGLASGALLPEEVFDGERALTDKNYAAAYNIRQQRRAAARKSLFERMRNGESLSDILASPDEDVADAINLSAGLLPKPAGYAAGGMVAPQGQSMIDTPAAPPNPVIQAYRDYAMQAQKIGVPAVPFEQFVQLKTQAMQADAAPAQQAPQGFAGGGAVEAAGKMVVDTDPDAGVDSIPAVVDGEQPAALNSGEFVIPTDVVKYFGTKYLDGLIGKARGEKTNGKSAER
jgi:hypothetical protein